MPDSIRVIGFLIDCLQYHQSFHHITSFFAYLATMSVNQAAWIDEKGAPLRVGDAPMPSAGPGEIVIRSRSVAINPLDWHMQDWGVFIKQWPSIFGCDVAGEVHEVGSGVDKFKPGDRVIAYVKKRRHIHKMIEGGLTCIQAHN